VIGHARIGAGNAVENIIDWNLSTFVIAVLARLNEPLRLAESCGLAKHDNLLFWCWVEEVAGHLESDFIIRAVTRRNLADSQYTLAVLSILLSIRDAMVIWAWKSGFIGNLFHIGSWKFHNIGVGLHGFIFSTLPPNPQRATICTSNRHMFRRL